MENLMTWFGIEPASFQLVAYYPKVDERDSEKCCNVLIAKKVHEVKS
jgi:hypothetical protein